MWGIRAVIRWRELRKCRKAEAQLKAPPNTEESHQSGEMQHYIQKSDAIWEWKQLILTAYWESRANSYGIPMPDREDESLWGTVEYDRDEAMPRYLTEAGILKIRADVREEEKYAREVWGFRCSTLVGVIGALIGLVSVFFGKH